MITFLLDTNTCIYIIKKKPITVFDRFHSIRSANVGISTITVAELQFGVDKSATPEKNQKALQQFLSSIEILDFNFDATQYYGKLRSQLAKSGTLIGSLDMLIAAHALSLNAILVTNNLKEFNRINGLKLENWINE